MSESELAVSVSSYAGYRSEETPTEFLLGTRKIRVVEVVDRWLAPDHRYFKVRGDDAGVYILRHDVTAGRWDLTMFSK